MDRKVTNNKGFTLIEVMIVTAIVGIILSISIDIFSRIAQKARIEEDMHNISTFLKSRRLTAFTMKQTIAITINAGGDTITATRDPGVTNVADGSISLLNPVVLSATPFTINSRGLFSTAGNIRLATANIPYSCVVIATERVRLGEWDGANCNAK